MKAKLILTLTLLGVLSFGDAQAQELDAAPEAPVAAAEAPAEAEEAPKPDEAPTEEAPAEEAEKPAEEGDAAEMEEGKEKPPESAIDQGKEAVKAAKNGEWIMLFGLIGMLLGGILRSGMAMKWEFWKTKTGGYAVAALTGLGILGYEIVAAGGTFSVSFLMPALAATAAAMGLHSPAKALKNKLKGEAA